MNIGSEQIKNADDNLGILRIIYGVSFSLGFFQIGKGISWPWNTLVCAPIHFGSDNAYVIIYTILLGGGKY